MQSNKRKKLITPKNFVTLSGIAVAASAIFAVSARTAAYESDMSQLNQDPIAAGIEAAKVQPSTASARILPVGNISDNAAPLLVQGAVEEVLIDLKKIKAKAPNFKFRQIDSTTIGTNLVGENPTDDKNGAQCLKINVSFSTSGKPFVIAYVPNPAIDEPKQSFGNAAFYTIAKHAVSNEWEAPKAVRQAAPLLASHKTPTCI